MTWVWATFWACDLQYSRTRGVMLLVPAVAFVFAAWPGRDRVARAALGAVVGLVPVSGFFVVRDFVESDSCSWGPSESYERAITWTFAAFVIWGLVAVVGTTKARSSPERCHL